MAGSHTTTHKEKDLSKAAFRLHLHVTSKVLKPRRGFQATRLGLKNPSGVVPSLFLAKL